MRNGDNEHALIADLEQQVEGKTLEDTLPDGVVEEGKRARRAHDPRFRFLYGSQESPSKALTPSFVKPG